MCIRDSLSGDDNSSVVAVIGDGSMTGGLAYEGLNNAGSSEKNLVVILNDNKMSISKNVGAISKTLTRLRSKSGYFRFKDCLLYTSSNIETIPQKLIELANSRGGADNSTVVIMKV